MDDFLREQTEALRQATTLQLLQYAPTLLGEEQAGLAKHLKVSDTTVSLWLSQRRPIPKKYRAKILEFDQLALRRALTRLKQDVAALPTAELRAAAGLAFCAPLDRWKLEVRHGADELQGRLRKITQQFLEILEGERLYARELDALARTWLELSTHMRTMVEKAERHGTPAPGRTDAGADDQHQQKSQAG